MAGGEGRSREQGRNSYDAVVVGAGFAGMYMLHRLRQLGLSAIAFEVGDGVGGTWYWNRYPGARCDVESLEYQYGFSDELQRGWEWTERYATQPEILRYQNYVADTLDLRRYIQFETRVTAASYDEARRYWTVETDRGDQVSANICIMASGCLSASRVPDIAGLEAFAGNWYHTGDWPKEGVDFAGKGVAVIGTGSSAVQAIPMIAEEAAHLTVFQRTPSFSLPAFNGPLDPARVAAAKEVFSAKRRVAEHTASGLFFPANDAALLDTPRDQVYAELEKRWSEGGFAFLTAFSDILVSQQANDVVSDFVRDKIRVMIRDPETADMLTASDYPFGTKRPCLDTNYYATFNQPNVTLVNVRMNPIERITASGIVSGGQEYPVDAIVFATGFDAMTGALLRIDIRGRDGLSLRDAWAAGPRTYLGLNSAGFPNLFFITGPGSPSVLAQVVMTIEQHVEWVTDCIRYLRNNGYDEIEALPVAQDEWVEHVNGVAIRTLFPLANSWFLGANVPGKPRVFMPYIAGLGVYRKKCAEVAAAGYEGFALHKKRGVADDAPLTCSA